MGTNRGKTSPSSTPGSFAPAPHGEADATLAPAQNAWVQDVNARLAEWCTRSPGDAEAIWAEARAQFDAAVDAGEVGPATMVSCFENALDRQQEEHAAVLVGAQSSAALREIDAVAERLGLQFRETEYGDRVAWLGDGCQLSLSPYDTSGLELAGPDGVFHLALVRTDGAGDPIRFDDPKKVEQWDALVSDAIRDAKKGGNIKRITDRLSGHLGDVPVFPRDLPDHATPAEVFTAIPDCSRVEVEVDLPNGQDGTVVIRGLARDIARWGSDLESEPRRITTESGFESFVDPATVRSIKVTDQSRVSAQWW